MKLLNWAREKLKNVGKTVGLVQEKEQRFNQVAPLVQAPDREKRSETRQRYRWSRWYAMPTLHGCPRLTGMRLLRTMSNCTGIQLPILELATSEQRSVMIKKEYDNRQRIRKEYDERQRLRCEDSRGGQAGDNLQSPARADEQIPSN